MNAILKLSERAKKRKGYDKMRWWSFPRSSSILFLNGWTWKTKNFSSHTLPAFISFPSCCLYARTEEAVHIRFFLSPTTPFTIFTAAFENCHWRRWCSKEILTKKQFLRCPSHSQIALTLHFFPLLYSN